MGVPARGSRGEAARASLGPVGFPAPLRAAPRSSAQAAGHREALESAVGRGEMGGGAGGGCRGAGGDGGGLSETKEFLKMRGEMRRGTREGAVRGVRSFGLGLFFPKLFLESQQSALHR